MFNDNLVCENKHKNHSLEVSHYYLISENNVQLFEERNSVRTTEYILYSSTRKCRGDSCLEKKKLKLHSHHLVL